LRQLVDTAEAHFLHVLATFDAHGDGEVLAGARSTTSWLRGALHLSGADAGGRVQLAGAAQTDLKITITRETVVSGRELGERLFSLR